MATTTSTTTTTTTTTTTILGKRKSRKNSLVLYVSATSESEYEPPHASSSKIALDDAPEKRYQCPHEGCDKSYTKPSRLEEHERSHTGHRPFVCTTCGKSYLRETHLQAHSRSHLSHAERPFACDASDCDKRFWTAQHLRVHQEVLHFGEKPFKCTVPDCPAAFLKHHQLRSHLATSHAPPGTKPYPCAHAGCDKSFSTSQKLRAHQKVHDDKRYTCVHAPCRPTAFYPTWSALQHHIRTDHPPTCPHAACRRKTFSSHKGLRAHLKLHEQRAAEDGSDAAEPEPGRPRKRRRGGELGRDWRCEEPGCPKDFESKRALATHHRVVHLGRRDFVCARAGCGRAYGYKHLLQRHTARMHTSTRPASDADEAEADEELDDDGDDDDDDEYEPAPAPAPAPAPRRAAKTPRAERASAIDVITGKAYKDGGAGATAKRLPCPYPAFAGLSVDLRGACADSEDEGARRVREPCAYVFGRAYDLRRHLRGAHGVELGKDEVDAWARGVRG